MIKRKKGYSLVEIMISLTIFAVVAAVSVNMLISIQNNNAYIQSINEMKSTNQEALGKLGRLFKTVEVVIGRGTADTDANKSTKYWYDYLTRFSVKNTANTKVLLSTNPNFLVNGIQGITFNPALGSSPFNLVSTTQATTLPVIDPNLSFSDESSSFKAADVGNSLIVGTADDTYTYKWTSSGGSLTGAQARIFDLMRIHYFFLAKNLSDSRLLTLVEGISDYYVDYLQLADAISTMGNTTDQTALMTNLKLTTNKSDTNKPFTLSGAWNYSERADSASAIFRFYTFGTSNLTGVASNSSASTFDILLKPTYFLNASDYGIAKNNLDANNNPITKIKGQIVPLFASPVPEGSSTAGFPHGFEVMINGSTAARGVFVRILSVKTLNGDKRVYNESTGLFLSRDS